jgi:hypothetical protein
MPREPKEPRVRLVDWLRQAGLAHGDRSMADVAASSARMRAASDAIRKALASVEGLTPIERRQILMFMAATESLTGVFEVRVVNDEKEPPK